MKVQDPFTKVLKFHYGMDFTAPRGTPIYATGDGIVRRVDSRSSGYGKHVRIDHGYGYTSFICTSLQIQRKKISKK